MSCCSATPPAPVPPAGPLDAAPLPAWLEHVTPLGADVLFTNASTLPLTAPNWIHVEARAVEEGPGMRLSLAAYRPSRHPSEERRSVKRVREARIAEAWLRAHALALALRATGIKSETTLAETVLWLARGGVRVPGVPIFDRLPAEDSSAWDRRETSGRCVELPLLAMSRRTGARVREVEAAAIHDLAGAKHVSIARAVGWQEGAVAGPAARKSLIYVQRGRQLLHSLGAWPWAHAEAGRLHEHPNWWQTAEFTEPLKAWLDSGWASAIRGQTTRLDLAMMLRGPA